MKIIVAGGRDFGNYQLLCTKLDFLFSKITPVVICGEARGADLLGKKYAQEHNIQVLSFPANWDKYGKSAGFRRNEEMAKEADALVAFWDGKSKGTGHMIQTMLKLGKRVKIVRY